MESPLRAEYTPHHLEEPIMAKSKAPEKPLAKSTADLISWIEADNNYALGIESGKLVCRNPAGKKLASVPKEQKESDLAEQLNALCEFLADHRTECLRRVELWMLRSLPVPCDVVRAVWPDPDWAEMLRNLVVTPADAQGKASAAQTGLLRDIDPKKGIGVVDRDGETQWIAATQILIPHPILIDGLDELREIAADLGFSQAIEQIFRPTYAATKEQKDLFQITDYTNGRFEQLNFASALCSRLGYPVRGGYACTKVWENATPIEARYWIGSDHPEAETYTGDLIFVDSEQKPLKIADVGRVTFSEGVRMASQIYAKRKVEKQEEGEP
jgi:hypothetical protein